MKIFKMCGILCTSWFLSYASYKQFYLRFCHSRSIQVPLVMHLVAAMRISLFLLIATYVLLSLLIGYGVPILHKNRNYDLQDGLVDVAISFLHLFLSVI